jgi:hypothetical protein
MKTIGALLAIAVVIGYGFLKAKLFIEGPQVLVSTPLDGIVVNNPLITVSGTAKNIAHLSLDGGKIFTDEIGTFHESRLLSYGYNTVTVSALDKFGRSTEKTLRIMYK